MPPIPMPSIRLDLSGMENLVREFDRPALLAALRHGALMGGRYVQGAWVKRSGDVRSSGEYIRGIDQNGQVREVSSHADPHSSTWEIVIEIVNTCPHASYVEDGHEAFHLPSRINWSGPKVKVSKKGVRYLSIAFRHTAYVSQAVSNAKGYTNASIKARMPDHIYKEAKRLSYSTRRGEGPIHDPQGQYIAADRYNWGARLHRPNEGPRFIMGGPGASAGGRGEPGYEEHRSARQVGRQKDGTPMVNPAWQGSKFGGMFKSGTKGHSEYMTIRTITQNSTGWNIPAQRGLGIARKVASEIGSDERLTEIVLMGMREHLEGRP